MSCQTKDGRTIIVKERNCVVCGKQFRKASSAEHATCSRECKYKSPFFKRFGANNHQWAGGQRKDIGGYVLLYAPQHPSADLKGYVREHRIILEAHLGRLLNDAEVVHHRNHLKDDNRLENLELMTNREHIRHHKLLYWKNKREDRIHA